MHKMNVLSWLCKHDFPQDYKKDHVSSCRIMKHKHKKKFIIIEVVLFHIVVKLLYLYKPFRIRWCVLWFPLALAHSK